MALRDYQERMRQAVHREFARGVASTLVISPTGTGKTHLIGQLCQDFAPLGRTMVLAHREELIFQAADKIQRMTGKTVEIEKAEHRASAGDGIFGGSKYVVASRDTMLSGSQGHRRMQRFDPNQFSLIVIDEAHRSPSAGYIEIVQWFRANPDLKVFGVTATPDRLDGTGLGCVFDSVAARYELPDAVNDGWLVPVTPYYVPVEGLDLSRVETTADGDLNQEQLGREMEVESTLHQIAHVTVEISCGLDRGFLRTIKDFPDRRERIAAAMDGRKPLRTLVFCTTVRQADRLSEIFCRWLPDSGRFVCGETETGIRRQMLSDYMEGAFPFLSNVGICCEGFDNPGIEMVVLARPSKSRALISQCVGRGTRPLEHLAGVLGTLPDRESRRAAIAASAKPRLIVLDPVGNTGKHKLVSTVDVLAGTNDDRPVIDRAREIAEQSAEPMDAQEALAQAEEEVDADREARRLELEADALVLALEREQQKRLDAEKRRHLVGTTTYDLREVDPYSPHDVFDVDRAPKPRGSSTEAQVNYLVRLGIKRETALTYSKARAGAVISQKQKRRLVAEAA